MPPKRRNDTVIDVEDGESSILFHTTLFNSSSQVVFNCVCVCVSTVGMEVDAVIDSGSESESQMKSLLILLLLQLHTRSNSFI